MAMRPLSIFQFLTPKDAESIPVWRERLAGTITLVVLAVALTWWALWSPTEMRWRFITAANAEETHEALMQDIGEIKKELASVGKDIGTLTENDEARAEREKQREIREVRSALLDLQLKACQAEGALRVALNQQVGELRSDYMALTGNEFPSTPCNELIGSN